MKGRPWISTSALGIVSVSGRSRVARPPARIATGCSTSRGLRSLGLRDNRRALEIEAEAHLLQARFAHGLAQAHLVLGVEHQESAAASPDQFTANRPVLPGDVVPVVDL